ncbi:MAG: hypothetical protein Q8M92_10105 [Candidatus Subteraquimicrobiales bacterium]|nr:hypothetical protein [Candidatus Subteraquimicrobiales bacterium]
MKDLLTLPDFLELLDDAIFDSGVTPNCEDGLFMTRSHPNRLLRWVAKKGRANDFAVYCLWADESTDKQVMSCGDKIYGNEAIKWLINCDDEVLAKYRR